MKRRTWLKGLFAGIVLRAHGVKPVKQVEEVKEIGISEALRNPVYYPNTKMDYPISSGTWCNKDW